MRTGKRRPYGALSILFDTVCLLQCKASNTYLQIWDWCIYFKRSNRIDASTQGCHESIVDPTLGTVADKQVVWRTVVVLSCQIPGTECPGSSLPPPQKVAPANWLEENHSAHMLLGGLAAPSHLIFYFETGFFLIFDNCFKEFPDSNIKQRVLFSGKITNKIYETTPFSCY